jgi:invasion protein IalB
MQSMSLEVIAGTPRRLAYLFLLFLAIGAAPSGALADRRIALVIGNSSYQTLRELKNPKNDSIGIANFLKNAGFDVVDAKIDLTADAFRRALREFAVKSEQADIAVVYFAGHGIEIGGINYLLPVDAKIATDLDAEDEAISLERVLRTVESASRLRLVILDACRDNPFGKAHRPSKTRTVERGLARIEIETADTYVAYAAKAGSTAIDGDGEHSPFTAALLQHLATPGLDLRLAFGKVRDQVLKETSRKQEPFVYGSLGGEVVAIVPTEAHIADPPHRPQPQPAPAKNEAVEIGAVKSLHDNWQVRCYQVGSPPKDQCALVQSVIMTEPATTLVAILIKTNEAKGGLLLRVITPSNVILPSGLGLKIDNEDIGRAGFTRCVSMGCVAEVEVDNDLLKKMKAGKTATFFISVVRDSLIEIPFNLAGISTGLAALP